MVIEKNTKELGLSLSLSGFITGTKCRVRKGGGINDAGNLIDTMVREREREILFFPADDDAVI